MEGIMNVTLNRVMSNEKGTFGVLMNDSMPLCVTLEDPWSNNERGISCIPEGEYRVSPFSGVKYKNVWIVNNVPNRSYILFHPGNSIEDTRGCILVGRSFNAHTIRDSRNAFDYLKSVLPDQFTLKIVNSYKVEKKEKENTFIEFLTDLFV